MIAGLPHGSMRNMSSDADRYPLGRFILPVTVTEEERRQGLEVLASFPADLHTVLQPLTEDELDLPYRPGGWSIRTLVHHVADSHIVAYSWMRLAMTEEWPTVYSYDPDRLAALNDAACSIHTSLQILAGVHERWVATFNSLEEGVWRGRGYIHPESGPCNLEQVLAMYVWHSKHHLAQMSLFVNGRRS